MKWLIILGIILFILLLKIKVNVIGHNLDFTLTISILFIKIKIDLNKAINKAVYNKKISYNDLKKNIKYLDTYKKLSKNFIKKFDGENITININSLYFLENLNNLLTAYYIYSTIQNLLLNNLNHIRETKLSNSFNSNKLYLNITLSTLIYKIVIFLIVNFKLIYHLYKEKKNEQSSNIRSIENING